MNTEYESAFVQNLKRFASEYREITPYCACVYLFIHISLGYIDTVSIIYILTEERISLRVYSYK